MLKGNALYMHSYLINIGPYVHTCINYYLDIMFGLLHEQASYEHEEQLLRSHHLPAPFHHLVTANNAVTSESTELSLNMDTNIGV